MQNFDTSFGGVKLDEFETPMIPRINELLQNLDRPAICLEYPALGAGGSSSQFAPRSLQISESGMSFSSFWRFEPGVEVAVSWQDHGGDHAGTGLVISCESDEPHSFRTTLFFVEKDLRRVEDKKKPARLNVQRV